MSESEQTLSIQPGYILVERPPGFSVELREQQASLKEVSALCMQAGNRKVLVVGPRTHVNLSTLDIFNLGQRIGELGLQVAVVELHDASHDDVVFLEDVATNRGGPLQFFDNVQDAKEWLGVA